MLAVLLRRGSVSFALLLVAAVAAGAVLIGGRAPSGPVVHEARKNDVSHNLFDDGAGWTSGNWSGYALTEGGYSQVSARWTVPTPAATPTPTYSAIWVGLDGFDNDSLIQIGTEQDYAGGSGQYYAWWEVLPSAEARVRTLTVHGGDRMSASIERGDGGVWTLAIFDLTTGQSFSTSQSYGGPASSAEWIVEAPNVGNQPTSLAHYGAAPFWSVYANGAGAGLTRSDGGTMIQDGQQVSTPSLPGLGGTSFDMGYGPTAPAAPML